VECKVYFALVEWPLRFVVTWVSWESAIFIDSRIYRKCFTEVSLCFLDNQYVGLCAMLTESSPVKVLRVYLVPYHWDFWTVGLALIQNYLVTKLAVIFL
jgi:hypothetical protein